MPLHMQKIYISLLLDLKLNVLCFKMIGLKHSVLGTIAGNLSYTTVLKKSKISNNSGNYDNEALQTGVFKNY